MDKLHFSWLIFIVTVHTCQCQDFIQIVGYMKLPMSIKLYVDQYGYSGPPRAIFVPAGAGGHMKSAGLSSGLNSHSSGSIANLLQQLSRSGGTMEREGMIGGGHNAPEVEGPNTSASLMSTLLANAQANPLMLNANALASLSSPQEAESSNTGGSGSLRSLGLLSGSNGAQLLQMLQAQASNLGGGNPEIQLMMSNSPDISQLMSSPSAQMQAKLQQMIAAGTGQRARRQVPQVSSSNPAMNDILARLKSQLKQALQKRMMKPKSYPTSSSGVTVFGAPRQAAVPTSSSTAPNNQSNNKVNILRTASQPKESVIKEAKQNATKWQKRPRLNKPVVAPVEHFNLAGSVNSPIMGANPFAAALNPAAQFSALLGNSNAVQGVQGLFSNQMVVNCVPGRTMPPETTPLGPVSEIQRYECLIPIKSKKERLVGSFSVVQGESMTSCYRDYDRVQIDGNVVQPICIQN